MLTIRSATIPTSAVWAGAQLPSTTRPPLIRISRSAALGIGAQPPSSEAVDSRVPATNPRLVCIMVIFPNHCVQHGKDIIRKVIPVNHDRSYHWTQPLGVWSKRVLAVLEWA